jgi:hypothetical protein
MTPTEAAALLTICAAYDNRKPDPDAAKAWAMALDGYRFEDCREAVVAHYRASREWIMPSDVIAAVKKVRGGRIEDVTTQPPAGLDPDDTGSYSRWLKSELRRVADGLPPTVQPYDATRAIGELRSVLRSVPQIEAKPPEKTAEHQAALDKARAELPKAAPIRDTEPPMQEPTEEIA